MRSLAEDVRLLEAEAISRLDAVLSGRALCRVDGASLRPAKHWEGRAAALAQVRRDLRRSAPPDREDELLERVRTAWTHQAAATAGDAWLTYTRGGLEALEELTRR